MENQCCWKLQHTLLLLTPFCPGAFCSHPITTPEREEGGGGGKCENERRGRDKRNKTTYNRLYRKVAEVNRAANVENHTSCVQNEWRREKGEEGGGLHSFFSYNAEVDEGVHTGACDAEYFSRVTKRFKGDSATWPSTGLIRLRADWLMRRLPVDRMGLKLHSWSD